MPKASDAELEEAGIDRNKCEFLTRIVMRALIGGATPREALAVLLSSIGNIASQQTHTFAQLEAEMLPGLIESLVDTVHTAWNCSVEAGIVRPEDNAGNPFQAPYVPPQHRHHAPGRA